MPPDRRFAHAYPRLVKRWKAIARHSGLALRPFASAGGYEIFYALPRGARSATGGLYASAGIHGDEAAGTEGLAEWAESATDFLRTCPVLLFPCLNPWGLVNNSRMDASGRDLNRRYHNRSVSQIAAQCRLLRGQRFALAMSLHEDYDAQGVYLYEVIGKYPPIGDQLLAAAARHIPRETRSSIDGSRCRQGLVRRKITHASMPGHPEAFLLHFQHAERTITLETPSEFSIDRRTLAQVAAMDAAANLVATTGWNSENCGRSIATSRRDGKSMGGQAASFPQAPTDLMIKTRGAIS